MNLKLFTEFLAQLKESRLISAANNPQYPTSKIGLGASEAKGNALRKIQEIQQQQEQLAQMQQQMQQQQQQGPQAPGGQQGRGGPSAAIR